MTGDTSQDQMLGHRSSTLVEVLPPPRNGTAADGGNGADDGVALNMY